MNRIKRYCTALGRFNRSKGYGVHSPFAFHFIRNVLREHCPYYAYNDIKSHRERAKKLSKCEEKKLHIISYKNAKLIFRIACYFSPHTILQIGTTYGVSTTTLLKVSQQTKIILSPGNNNCNDIVYHNITQQYQNRILSQNSFQEAANLYLDNIKSQPGFVLINIINNQDYNTATNLINSIINGGGVVIIRNLSHSQTMRQLWRDCCQSMTHGMSFSNYQIGIIVGHTHLPKQHFKLWF